MNVWFDFLLAATKHEMWPPKEMLEDSMSPLKENFPNEHVAIAGEHTEPLDHVDLIFGFLNEHFKN